MSLLAPCYHAASPRDTSGLTPTDYQYTGQRNEAALGVYFYNARWYDPALGRFAQADTLIPGAGNPLAWDRYAYVNDNPLRYSDPSGHCPWCITIGLGALIGAGVTYGVQVAANVSQNGLNVQAFTDVNWATVGTGAVAGAVGGATFGLGTAVLGTGLAGTVAAGAVSGAVAGQSSIAAENVFSGQEITEGLGRPGDIARDAVIGGALAGVGYATEQVTTSVLARMATHNPDSRYVILGGYPNYRNVGSNNTGFTYFEMSPRMWNVTDKLGLAEDINIRFMEQQAGQGKTFLVTLAYNRPKGILAWGTGTEREIAWLATRSDYVNVGGKYLWQHIGSIMR